MKSAGLPVSCAGVAAAYRDFLDVLVIDESDGERSKEVEATGVRACAADTIMDSDAKKLKLAQTALQAVQQRMRKGA